MPARYPENCPEGFMDRYFVVAGDTMEIIAQYFGTTKDVLIEVNPHITDPDVLNIGDVLCVPGFRKPASCPANFKGNYEVKDGDTMYTIARMFNVSKEELIAANPHIPNPSYIFPFDVLCVPETAAMPALAKAHVKVNESNNGGVVCLQPGQRLELTLEENASTGYSWEYRDRLDTDVLQERRSWVENPEVPRPGAPGKHHWLYRAINPGQTTIDLWYIQAWLAEPVPAKTFTLKAKVLA